ncbi:MAG: hypothetical protein V8S03_06425 [Faecalimonas umbilicata]|uniref:hypothetical protein n=1 Tax=Faecalimonas umbilicata TaxID=1912855 RepID=UPI00300F3FA4
MMNEISNPYVKYLNGLHNYNAQNPNAYGEKNVESPYYEKTMVEMNVCQHIIKALTSFEPHILVLTGHAGDGKTSLMYQVLSKLGIKPDFSTPIVEHTLATGQVCCCIKDFSELSDEKKLEMMKKIVTYPSEGKYVFMVANTGPLINTFGKLFDDENEIEQAKMQLIGAMDDNKGDIIKIVSYPFLVINVAAIDNTAFPTKYLSNVIKDELWADCSTCQKREYCHIFHNQKLIKTNQGRVFDFLSKYYIWETEYGHRMTIRSMTEQLAYMMTGGVECEDIVPIDLHKMMFFNLFFGYVGTIQNAQAQNVLAVKLAYDNHFDQKRLRADEDLIIKRSYDELFSPEVVAIIHNAEKTSMFLKGWAEELRRIYFFLNIVPDESWRRDTEDVFSKQYTTYLDVRGGASKPSKSQKMLIIDALRMMYLGTVVSNSNTIPITLSKESGIAQSVQLVVGELSVNDIEVISKPDSALNMEKQNLVLRVQKKEEIKLSLPMIDYFEELRNGVISTNIDPQLSHGIESMKAQLLKVVYIDGDDLEMIVLNNNGYEKINIEIDDNVIRLN